MALLQGCLSPGGNGDSYGGMRNEGSFHHVVDASTCAVSSEASSLGVHSRIRLKDGKATIEGGCAEPGAKGLGAEGARKQGAPQEIPVAELKPLDDSGKLYLYQDRVYEFATEEGVKDLKQTFGLCFTLATMPAWPFDQYQARVLAGTKGDFSVLLDYLTAVMDPTGEKPLKESSYVIPNVDYSSSSTERRLKGEGLEIVSQVTGSAGSDGVMASSFKISVRGPTDLRQGMCHYMDFYK